MSKQAYAHSLDDNCMYFLLLLSSVCFTSSSMSFLFAWIYVFLFLSLCVSVCVCVRTIVVLCVHAITAKKDQREETSVDKM